MATKTFTSMVELENMIMIPIVENLLDSVTKDVKAEIDEALSQYENEFTPDWYHRTDQLRNCCKIGKIQKSGNSMYAEVYLDIDSLSYSAKGADPWKSVVSADSGLHGGWDISDMSQGQIPWSDISDGNSDYGGTRIWSDPMEELFDKGKLKQMFIKYAKQYGLTIR